MAPVTYYYIFSMTLLLASGTWLINLIYMRLKSRTILGRSYTVGTPLYDRVMKVASGRNILITTVIMLLTIVNLAWSITTVLGVNTPSSQLLLVSVPIVLLIAWAFMMLKARKEYGTNTSSKESYKKAPRKRGKDDDSWLS